MNWRNPELREAMLDVLRFWLDRSVDGFRVDVKWLLIKDDQFRITRSILGITRVRPQPIACCHSS